MTEIRPLPEQEAVIQAVIDNVGSLDVDALAGAGKSTTLRMAAPHIQGRVLVLAFNFGIKESLKSIMPDNFQVMTLNGLGHRAFGKFKGSRKLNVSQAKIYAIVRRQMESMGWAKGVEGYDNLRELVLEGISMARNNGLVPIGAPLSPKAFHKDTPEEWFALANLTGMDLTADNYDLVIPIVRACLLESIQSALQGSIDFADQIYMSCCFGGQFDRVDTVMVDEAQDLSPLNHFMVGKSAAGGRLIAVGDERQGIYAFRGADANSIPNLRAKFKTTTLPLSTTFRCARSIVTNVQGHAPHMRAAPWAPEGQVTRKQEWALTELKPLSMVICRNNAPLINLAFKMIRYGIPPKMLGGEMDRQLNSFILRLADGNPAMSETALIDKVDAWLAKEIAEADARDNPMRAERARDRAECVKMIPGKTAQEMMKNLAKLFENEDALITLSTGHKSKGLEAETIYHLDSDLLPSRMAVTPEQQRQEANLRYVVDTRAKLSHTYLSSSKVEAL